MLNQQTREQLQQLRLQDMLAAYDEQTSNPTVQALNFDERFASLIQSVMASRDNRSLDRRIKNAGFKYAAYSEDIDYQTARGLDRQLMMNLLQCDWIANAHNLILTGMTGSGKTWLGIALGYEAARKGYTVKFIRQSRLCEQIDIAYGLGNLHKYREKLQKFNLLILDDWGLASLNKRNRHELLEIIDDRGGEGSLLVTSQLPIDKWHDYIGDATIADAILDRVMHRSHHINLHGESMRKQLANEEV